MVRTRWKAYVSTSASLLLYTHVYATKQIKPAQGEQITKGALVSTGFVLCWHHAFGDHIPASTFNWKIINHRGKMVLFKLQILWRSAWVHFQVTFSKAYFEVKSGVVFYCGDTSLHRWSLKETGRKEIWSFFGAFWRRKNKKGTLTVTFFHECGVYKGERIYSHTFFPCCNALGHKRCPSNKTNTVFFSIVKINL